LASFRLRLIRQAVKLSHVDLCRTTSISPEAWNNAETGDNLIGIVNAKKLCGATGVTLDWIYQGVRSNLPKVIAQETRQKGRLDVGTDKIIDLRMPTPRTIASTKGTHYSLVKLQTVIEFLASVWADFARFG
jgi:hypothetical protein